MKFLSDWLRKILATKKSSGEEIEKSESSLDRVVVGKILEIKKHPNADRLQIAIVETMYASSVQKLQIVCGAPNIKVGQLVPVALPGAKLLNGMEIKEAEIRGVKSFGMLCAEDELGLNPDHSGIMILDSPPHQCGYGDKSKKQNAYWCGGKKAEIGMEFVKYINLNK